MKRGKAEQLITNFENYGDELDALIEEEVRTKCMMGMLLCLDRKQRLVFILRDIFVSTNLYRRCQRILCFSASLMGTLINAVSLALLIACPFLIHNEKSPLITDENHH